MSNTVLRYLQSTDEDGCYRYDIIWTDRTTGKVVLRYDGVDPANTNPAYGAISDAECFSNKGLDINEEIDPALSKLPVRPGEAEDLARRKALKAEREAEEAAAVDLGDVIGEKMAGFSCSDWREGERTILKPALEELGYTDVSFYMIEQDSFGPLSRGVIARDKDGKRVRFYYG